jgi:16S rRNA (guanine527-N7)-methyltransferase
MGGNLSQEVERVLPAELPRRAALVEGTVRHAELVLAANERLNLTRLTAPRDVAVKHVLDCLLPWRRFVELFPESANSAARAGGANPPATAEKAATPVLADLGSGAGYPGLLLALLLPHVRVLLVESIGKKAAFLGEVVRALSLRNAEVHAVRAEELLAQRKVDVVTARAVGSARDLLRLLKPARGRFGRLLLYKGPDVEQELAQAAKDAAKLGLAGAVTFRGELPDGAGARFLLEYAAS